ncbi:MAG: type III pantothenate kinase [Gammaproteobacteria bacterium]|jgi:type III pantothenate kinase|nr:type III pantothenate kinase [Gammaproteobacteria bacterium]MBQ0774400.1 type III pantothenate kinase [Gammaproteobacteria bacterium]|tara:strand:- start:840 stop:1592 length:753 start_codon:yes stop_codon:yes gene_type:complete
MVLYLDVGNTALKWRCYHDGTTMQGGGVHCRDWAEQIETLSGALPAAMPDRIVIGSVAGRDADALLREEVVAVLKREPEFYYSPQSWNGLVNSYDEPSRLGVDRWLAVVEAWHRSGAAIIIDCGSAITLDVVGRDGRHGGGFIVPGMKMLEQSLIGGTGSVRTESVGLRAFTPGVSTSECVHNGILLMCVAFVTDAVVALQNTLQDTCSIYMTGGDASALQPYLTAQVDVVPDMVLDGLERIFPQTDVRG